MDTLIEITGEGAIIFVDDDEDFHKIMNFLYSRNTEIDNEIVNLYSGSSCLEYLEHRYSKNREKELPAMILMDINMPTMDGVETVIKIREIELFKETPIISMLSSSNNPSDIERSMAAGATKYYEKPFQIDKFKFVKIE